MLALPQHLSSFIMKQPNLLFTEKGKKIHRIIIIIPCNLQWGKAYDCVEQESVLY